MSDGRSFAAGGVICLLVLWLCACSGRPVELGRADQGELLDQSQVSVASGRGFNPLTLQMLGWAGLSDASFDARVQRLTEWLASVGADDRSAGQFRIALSEVLLAEAFDRLEASESPADETGLAGLFLESAWQSWQVVSLAVSGSEIGGGAGSEMLTGQTRLALDLYNASVGGVVETLSSELSSGEQDFWVDVPVGEPWAVSLDRTAEGSWDPTEFQRFRPASTVSIEGLRYRHSTDSLGAALIAEKLPGSLEFPDDVPPNGFTVPATAVVSFPPVGSGLKNARLAVYDPMRRRSIDVWDRQIVLSADWTAPLADIVAKSRIDQAGRRAMLSPGQFEDDTGLFRLQPYDENKIPVLFVHGLRSSPLTWRDVLNDLQADPEIRERYQFWTFFYPSGLPIPRSAYFLRTGLEKAKDRYDPEGDAPWRGKMVIVGHSMGGVISRAILKDVGDGLYFAGHTVPPEDFDMSDELKDHLREVFFYEPEQDVSRAIFVSSPFRGSELSESWFGSLGRGLTSLSGEFRQIRNEYLNNNQDKLHPWFQRRGEGTLTGVGSLSPENPFFAAYDAAPWRDGLQYHVIVGNESGDGDGVVKYWSSQLDGTATPEVVVDSGHNAHQTLAGGAAIWEILKLHLRELDAAGAMPAQP